MQTNVCIVQTKGRVELQDSLAGANTGRGRGKHLLGEWKRAREWGNWGLYTNLTLLLGGDVV